MNILILRANPRKGGHTQKLTDLFVEGLKEGQAKVQEIDLSEQIINYCIGCYNCWLVHPGECIHDDDMAHIMDAFTRSDIVVFSTPLYIYNISAYLKTFLDRLLPYMRNEHLTSPAGSICNAIRDPKHWPKKMAYILVGAFRGPEPFEAARKSLQLFADGLMLPLCGELVRPESYLLPFTYLKPKTIRNVKSSFKKAGYELATKGKIAKVTMDKVSASLSENIEHFIEDSNIYWQEAEAIGDQAKDPDYVTGLVVRNPKILISEMVRHIDPKATARLKASIQFDFPDKNLHFHIRVEKGKCVCEEKRADTCDLRITTTSDIWAQIFLREINAREALMKRQIELSGDKQLFARLDKYFPLPCD